MYKVRQTGDRVQAVLDKVESLDLYPEATQFVHGIMSTEDKAKLDELEKVEALTNAEIREMWNLI